MPEFCRHRFKRESSVSVSETLPYEESREQFRRLARSVGWEISTIGEPLGRPTESEQDVSPTAALAWDVAWRGPFDAPRLLIISAGLHGVEGFFGSQLLLDWFRTAAGGMTEKAGDLRMVAVHCLNPFGYAQRRRTDQQNIDLNRNFSLAVPRSAPTTPAFAKDLDQLLNPRELRRRPDGFRFRLWRLAARHGAKNVRQAIAGGQFTNPHGLFFGGSHPSRFFEWCEGSWGKIVGSAERVTHLDLHSGLGRYGTARLLLQPGLSDAGRERMRGMFGSACVPPVQTPPPTDRRPSGAPYAIGYQAHGTWGSWLQQRFGDRQYEYACTEFGTYSPLRVLAALRDENAAWHLCGPDSPERERAADRLQECFYPGSTRWRVRVRARFLSLLSRVSAARG